MSPPHTAIFPGAGARQKPAGPAGPAGPGHKNPGGVGSPVWVVAEEEASGPHAPRLSPAGNPGEQICVIDPRGHRTQKRPTARSPRLFPLRQTGPRNAARRKGEDEWHLSAHLLVHLHHLYVVLVLSLVLRYGILCLPKMVQAMLTPDPQERPTGTAARGMSATLHGVVGPQTLETESMWIRARDKARAGGAWTSFE